MSIPRFPSTAHRPERRCRLGQRGFTLVELIMVLVILGVLSAYALPRLFDTKAVYARGFHDETMGYLRFAQKTAIAQRRTVCVTFTSTTVTLAIASAAATFDCATAGTLTGPKGTTGATVSLTAQRDAAFDPSPALPTDFNFDGLGQPITGAGVASATQTFAVTDSGRTITVETATGYIHENL